MFGIYRNYKIIPKIRKLLAKSFALLQDDVIEAAQVAATQNPPTDQVLEQLPFVKYIFFSAETFLYKAAEQLSNVLFDLQSNASHIYQCHCEVTQRVNTKVLEIETELKDKLATIKTNFADKQVASTGRIQILRTSLETHLKELLSLPRHRLWWRVICVVIFSLIIGFGDAIFISNAFHYIFNDLF